MVMRKTNLPNYGEGEVEAAIGVTDADGNCHFDHVTCEFQITQLPSAGGRHMPPEPGDWFPTKVTSDEGVDVTSKVTQEQLEMLDKAIRDQELIESIIESNTEKPYWRPWPSGGRDD